MTNTDIINLDNINVRRDWHNASSFIVESSDFFGPRTFESASAAAEFLGLDSDNFEVVDNHKGYHFTSFEGLVERRDLAGRDEDDRLTLTGTDLSTLGIMKDFAGSDLVALVRFSLRNDI